MYNVIAGGDKMIDLISLVNGQTEDLLIKESIILEKDYHHLEIHELSPLDLDLKIELDEDVFIINGTVKGTMKINDALTDEVIDYNFISKFKNEEIDEINIINDSLDLQEFLLQSIVVEVPLRYTKVKDLSEIEEKDFKFATKANNTNRPFQDLESIMREE